MKKMGQMMTRSQMEMKIVTDPAILIMTILNKNIIRETVTMKELSIEITILEIVMKKGTTQSPINWMKRSCIDDI